MNPAPKKAERQRLEMRATIDSDLESAIKRGDAAKALATSDENGTPNVIFSPFLHLDDDGNLAHLELLESSKTNRNLTRAIWFDRKATISVRTPEGREWSITGTPFKVHISGPVYQRNYLKAKEAYGDADLAGVWIIKPEAASEETHSKRLAEQDERHPFYRHLDRLATDKDAAN